MRAFLMRRFRQWFGRISSKCWPFCQMKVRPFSKTVQRFVYYRSKSKIKAVLRVNYGDSGTVVL